MPAQLLVSVRDPWEAEIAALAGVPIIDLKDPQHGSLGRPAAEIIDESVSAISRINPEIRISCACGEVNDQNDHALCSANSYTKLSFLKLGLSELAHDASWSSRWEQTRRRIDSHDNMTNRPGWVGVVYADHRCANSPPAGEIISAAAATDCAGILFDTYSKKSGRLFDSITEHELTGLCEQIHSHGLFCAAAGRLRIEDAQRLTQTPVDIIAVRSAVCLGQNRSNAISRDQIVRLLEMLDHSGTRTDQSSLFQSTRQSAP